MKTTRKTRDQAAQPEHGPFDDAILSAFDRVDHSLLSVEGGTRLLHYAIRNHPEARGHGPTEKLIAKRLFDEHRSMARAAIEAFRDAVAPSRRAEALLHLQDFVKSAVAALQVADFDELERTLVGFSYVRNSLSQPISPPSREHEVARTAVAGWTGCERDFLAAELGENDTPLVRIDARQVTTAHGRVISRQTLREKYRPESWTRNDTWDSQFPPIPEERS